MNGNQLIFIKCIRSYGLELWAVYIGDTIVPTYTAMSKEFAQTRALELVNQGKGLLYESI